MRADRLPLWLRVLIVAALAVCEHALWTWFCAPAPLPGAPRAVSLAFWGWLAVFAQLLWDGVQAVAALTVEVLHWLLLQLWAIVTSIGTGLVQLGKTLKSGFLKAWDFLGDVYGHVLKPAWDKFWNLFDRVRRWLVETFQPILDFLHTVRDELLCFYKAWIRPILDIVDATRGILRVLAALHVPFAAALERQIGKVEEWVNQKFELVLSTLNAVINLVNRVVTADGLFQRIAYIRTYARDIHHAGSLFWHTVTKGMSAEEVTKRKADDVDDVPPAQPGEQLGKYYSGGGGEFDGIIGELAPLWREAAGLSAGTTAI